MEIRQRMKLLEAFRQERIKVVASSAPVPLPGGGRFILHLIPSSWLEDPGAVYDVAAIEFRKRAFPLFGDKAGAEVINGFNYDGQLFYFGPDLNTTWSYVQFFFSGIVEAVEAYHFTRPAKFIPIFDLEKEVFYKLLDYLEIQSKIGVQPPVFLMLSIIGASGYGIEGKEFEVGEMFFPPQLIKGYEDFDKNEVEILKPIVNRIWNASGYPGSLSFMPGGQFFAEKKR